MMQRKVLKNNHESLVYSNNMLKALEKISSSEKSKDFEDNLKKQEANITEPGELEATREVRANFTELLAAPARILPTTRKSRMGLQIINDLNQNAILKKNNIVQRTANDAKLWLTIIFTVLFLVTLTFILISLLSCQTPLQN